MTLETAVFAVVLTLGIVAAIGYRVAIWLDKKYGTENQ